MGRQQALRDQTWNLPLRQSFCDGVSEDGGRITDAALGAGRSAAGFVARLRGQQYEHLTGFESRVAVENDILVHTHTDFVQRLGHKFPVGHSLQQIPANGVECLQFAGVGRLDHLAGFISAVRRDLFAP